MNRWQFEDVLVLPGNLTRALNQLKSTTKAVKVSGVSYTHISPYIGYTDCVCVNDNHIFGRNPDGSWEYYDDTVTCKAAKIGDYTEEFYSIMCDRGSFVINGLAFHNGVGDGTYKLIVRTFDSRRDYYTRSEIRKRVYKVYPDGGECKVLLYDCAGDYLEFDHVAEIQIATGKLYVIRIVKDEKD